MVGGRYFTGTSGWLRFCFGFINSVFRRRMMAAASATEVVVFSRAGLQQEIWAGAHTLLADEPVEAGGAESGPDPYQLLLGALGACTAMTLLLYARRKGWDLQQVEVRLRHDRIYAQDCAECETKEGRVDRIAKEITVAGALDD